MSRVEGWEGIGMLDPLAVCRVQGSQAPLPHLQPRSRSRFPTVHAASPFLRGGNAVRVGFLLTSE